MIFFLQNGTDSTQVMEIQSILKKLGFYQGKVDGLYEENTIEAVKAFQKFNGIKQDGIVGPVTYKTLEKYILGYTFYKIKPNDTIYKIAKENNSTINLILSANPTIEPKNLIPNTMITVPFNYEYARVCLFAKICLIKYALLQRIAFDLT